MNVWITAEAEADLEAIADHIALDNPARAFSFLQDLREACLGLADLPLAFQLIPHYEQMGIRRRVHGNYLIFYRVQRKQVIILHVLAGAMDYTRILFDPP